MGAAEPIAEVRLRLWESADAQTVEAVLDDPQLLRWSHMAELGAERWIGEQQRALRGPSLAICTKADGRALGKVALRLPGEASAATTCAAMRAGDQPAGELSYWVIPEARGRGIATSGVLAMLELARDLGTMRSVVLDIETDNAPSLKLADKVSAQRRDPVRVEVDRQDVARTLAVHVVTL